MTMDETTALQLARRLIGDWVNFPTFGCRHYRDIVADALLAASEGIERDVACFHVLFGQPTPDRPTPMFPETTAFRIAVTREEARECVEALESGDPARIAHESVDQIYVALGNLVALGVRFGPVWREVHAANMAKIPCPDGGKPLKPPGWRKADVAGAIARQTGALLVCAALLLGCSPRPRPPARSPGIVFPAGGGSSTLRRAGVDIVGRSLACPGAVRTRGYDQCDRDCETSSSW